MTKEEIGGIIRESRIAAGYTQAQIAQKINRPQQTIANWEGGKSQPDANTLFELFILFDRSIDEAFGFYESKNSLPDLDREREKHLLKLYRGLNPEGQEKVVDYADDLIRSGKYKKYNSSELDKDA